MPAGPAHIRGCPLPGLLQPGSSGGCMPSPLEDWDFVGFNRSLKDCQGLSGP